MLKMLIDPVDTMKKTLMTSRLFDGFWDRWIAHGIMKEDIEKGKEQIISIEDWVNVFQQYALDYEKEAIVCHVKYDLEEAERNYRKAGLYYNLIQWIYPERCSEKIHYYEQSIELFKLANELSDVNTKYVHVEVDGKLCSGTIKIPTYYKGCMIIVNPIDSSKEELYSYEKHFLELGFVTVSFDGPGQGETFVLHSLKATQKRWKVFLDKVINLTHKNFPSLEIGLFGTSSGAAWAIRGSKHSLVSKVIAVSPPMENKASLPGYFEDRLQFVTENKPNILPDLTDVSACKSVILFHGNKDVMVNDYEIYNFFVELPEPKRIVEYAEEGHCCNNKLEEVREIAARWFFTEGNVENDTDI